MTLNALPSLFRKWLDTRAGLASRDASRPAVPDAAQATDRTVDERARRIAAQQLPA